MHQCKYCSAYLSDKLTLSLHLEVEHRGCVCTESGCYGQFRCVAYMEDHVKSKHRNIKYPCEHCGKMLSYASSLTNHARHCPARPKPNVEDVMREARIREEKEREKAKNKARLAEKLSGFVFAGKSVKEDKQRIVCEEEERIIRDEEKRKKSEREEEQRIIREEERIKRKKERDEAIEKLKRQAMEAEEENRRLKEELAHRSQQLEVEQRARADNLASKMQKMSFSDISMISSSGRGHVKAKPTKYVAPSAYDAKSDPQMSFGFLPKSNRYASHDEKSRGYMQKITESFFASWGPKKKTPGRELHTEGEKDHLVNKLFEKQCDESVRSRNDQEHRKKEEEKEK